MHSLPSTLLSLLIFPAAVAVVYLLLLRGLYRGPGVINQTFERYLRPPRLKTTIRWWMVGIGVVFLFVQWLRVPYYADFLSRVAHLSSLIRTDPSGLLILGGIGVMLVCEWIIVVHWMAYLAYCWIGTSRYHLPKKLPLSDDPPEVLVLICCCDEEPETVRRSLETVARLHYPRMQIYLLENSRNLGLKAQAAQLAGKYGVEVLHIRNRGHKAGAMNDALAQLRPRAPYLAIIDADQRVHPEFLRDLVPYLEQDHNLAFVQTPQLYDNADETWLCRAAAQQETLLYDTIMEAKSALGRALCCGTNFVMRRRALEDVGGWDEASVSEDLATSFLLHRRGWTSLYLRRAYAWGLGPLNLFSYWKQQARWAVGNTTVVKQVIKALLRRKPEPTPPKIALGYLWSAGYYVTALALAGLATLPILLLVASYVHAPHALQPVPAAKPVEWLFLSVYPFYLTVMLFPYVNMRMRGYPLRNLVMLQGLLAITIPVYIGSVLKGLFTRFTFFVIAPKGLVGKRPALVGPQAVMFLIFAAAGCLLTLNVMRNAGSSVAWIVLFWTFFYTVSLGHYFVFTIQDRLVMARHTQAAAMREPEALPDLHPAEVIPTHVKKSEARP